MTETKTQIYGVVLPLNIAHRARIVAATKGKSRSGLMRDLLVEYLRKFDELTELSAHPVLTRCHPASTSLMCNDEKATNR